MYKYVEFKSGIYFGYVILRLKHIDIIKHNSWIFTSEQNLYIFSDGKNLMDFNTPW